MPRPKKTQTQKPPKIDFGLKEATDWDVPRLRTGLLPVDWVMSGGFGFGRAAELYGDYSTCKTVLLYLALIQNQREGGVSILFEEEGAFNREFFMSFGGDPDALFIFREGTVEAIFDAIKFNIVPAALANPKVKFVVGWDSIACTSTKHLEEKGMDKIDLSKAKMMSQGCMAISDDLIASKVCLIANNQTRTSFGGYMPTTTTPGGAGFTFLCSQRLELRFHAGREGKDTKILQEGDSKTVIGKWIRVKIEKSKLGSANLYCDLPFYMYNGEKHPVYGYATQLGFDVNEALFDFYLHSRFCLKPTNPDAKPWEGPKVLQELTQKRFALTERIDPEQKPFKAPDWLEKLEQFPILKTLALEPDKV